MLEITQKLGKLESLKAIIDDLPLELKKELVEQMSNESKENQSELVEQIVEESKKADLDLPNPKLTPDELR